MPRIEILITIITTEIVRIVPVRVTEIVRIISAKVTEIIDIRTVRWRILWEKRLRRLVCLQAVVMHRE